MSRDGGGRAEKGVFTVTLSRPTQILTAAPRCDDDDNPSLELLQTIPATVVDGVLLPDAYLHFECEPARIVDGFGENSLVTGRIIEKPAFPSPDGWSR
tara:strand:+ start:361 stop:654 length:294 start_codon:yes stop_codon:yes gene_type:complete